MTTAAFGPIWPLSVLMLPAGVAFGLCYFHLLRLSADAFGIRRSAIIGTLVTLVRGASAAVAFALAARRGALPVLALFAGFLAAREIALRPRRGVS